MRLLDIPYWLLFPDILLLCAIGVYSINNESGDVLLAAGAGFLGYLFLKLQCEPAPLLLGFVLGGMMEERQRRAMLLSRGDAKIFITSPLSAVLLACAAMLLLITILPAVNRGRERLVED